MSVQISSCHLMNRGSLRQIMASTPATNPLPNPSPWVTAKPSSSTRLWSHRLSHSSSCGKSFTYASSLPTSTAKLRLTSMSDCPFTLLTLPSTVLSHTHNTLSSHRDPEDHQRRCYTERI